MKKFLNSKTGFILIFVSILIVAFIIRIYKIGQLDFWRDEAFTILQSKKGIPEILQITSKDTNAPLHQIILYFWMLIFGTSEFAVRLPSVLFSIGSLVYTYLIARKIFLKRDSLLILLLSTISILSIFYAREARAYSLLTFLLAGSFYNYSTLIKKFSRKCAFWFVCFSALAFYTHNTALLFIGVEILYLFIIVVSKNPVKKLPVLFRMKKKLLKQWGIMLLSLGVLIFPWLVISFTQAKQVDETFWITFDPINTLNETLTGLTVAVRLFSHVEFDIFDSLLNLLMLFFLFVGTSSELIHWKKQKIHFSLFFWIPLFLLYFISFRRPILYVRYVSFLTPYMTLLLFKGIKSITKNQIFSMIVIIIMVILSLKVYTQYYISDSSSKPHYKEVVRYLEDSMSANDIILHKDALSYFPFAFYSGKDMLSTIYDPQDDTPFYIGRVLLEEKDFTRDLSVFKDFDTIWMISLGDGVDKDTLGDDYALLNEKSFEGNLTLQKWYHYEKTCDCDSDI